jgi:phenylpropionate dioxygenase-like ring-hydroxylating dioxygenase large terminal subunit
MKYIFERTWNYLALESEIGKPNDYVTRHIGRTPVIVMRDAKGKVGAFINACRHKGATVCRLEEGNAKYHVCPYHGWAYDASGKNVDIKDRSAGAYAPAFEAENHDLLPVARVAIYKGMIFGSLSADVPALEEHLGDLKFFLDLHMEQSPVGMEVIPGRALYTYRGNWKMQLENGQDPYHETSTHGCFVAIQERRMKGAGADVQQLSWKKRAAADSGTFGFERGHASVWIDCLEPEKRPVFPMLDEISKRVGKTKADWMLKQRNAVVFPNLQLGDQIVPQLRTFRPIAVDRTELRTFVLAPIGESPDRRAARMRLFEDFINPCGFATPDDVAMFNECQANYAGLEPQYLQAYGRGVNVLPRGSGGLDTGLGIHPAAATRGRFEMQPETGTHAMLREWLRLMEAGLSGR